jgi:uncharacterized membrane protein required for colicin V production
MQLFGMEVHVVDVVIALVLVTFGLRGYLRGLYAEITALVALVAALAAAFRWTPAVVTAWGGTIPGPAISDTLVAFLLLFGAIGLALRTIFGILRRALSADGSSAFDRLGGAAFGLCKGGVALGCTVLLLRTFAPLPAGAAAAKQQISDGLLARVNGSLMRSPSAAELARVTSRLFSTFADAAEIRLRMLAASDNEGP